MHKKWFLFLLFLFTSMTYAVAHAETIVGNCDSMLFLGGKERTTLKEISELLGKETIDLDNTSENRGREKSHGISHQRMGKELMSQDELAVLENSKCILQLRGERPFLSDKYDITKHPNYRFLSDADPELVFNINKDVGKRMQLENDQKAELYEIGISNTQIASTAILYSFLFFMFSNAPYPAEITDVIIAVIIDTPYITLSICPDSIANIGISTFDISMLVDNNIWYISISIVSIIIDDMKDIIFTFFSCFMFLLIDTIIGISIMLL